jgi:pSer/pThr/pTyr-binding forkhead associated (FHA) protein
MSNGLDQILRYFLLALLWLFFLYAARVVIVDVKRSRSDRADGRDTAQRGTSAPDGRHFRVRVTAPSDRAGQTFEIDDEVTVGRSPACAITLAGDTFASSVHARLFGHDGSLWIEDLGSTNGTYLNEARIDEPARVRRSDKIRVGSTTFELAR